MKKISLIIPCFNEEDVLPELFERVSASVKEWKHDWEVICVDDGSRDNTWQLLREQSNADPHWKVISFSRNFGHQIALSCGLHFANGDAAIIIDADLQDPPEELGRFIEKWEEGYDVVYAVRTKRKESLHKRFSYWLFYRLIRIVANFELPLDSGDFCIIDRKVINVLKSMPEKSRYLRGMRAWAGFKQMGLEYERHSRASGRSKYSLKKLLDLAFNGILSFSSVPLVLISYFGLAVSFISLLGIIFTFLQRIFKDYFSSIGIGPVPGFATIVISILFLGGVQLISLGIIGSYIGRIYDEVKGRPSWIIKDSVGL